MPISTDALTLGLKAEAARLGFDQVGVAPAVVPAGFEHFQGWLRDGYAAGMNYMHRQSEARSHPNSILDSVRSVIVCSMVYGKQSSSSSSARSGKIARYARGADYHEVLWRKLETLLGWIKGQEPEIQGRAVADTAPLLERDFARLAGLGWVGKNTMLIDRKLGSYTVLGALLVDRELIYDAPHETSHCGTCTRCLDLCPTDAFDGAYRLDAGKCLSYWTIEHRGEIPESYADKLDGWAFGCDICQEVCPWNRKAAAGLATEFQERAEWSNPDLIEWLTADPAEFRRRIKGTAMSRAKRSGLLRNAALILGQRGVKEAIPALTARLQDEDPIVRWACDWALKQMDVTCSTTPL